MKKHLLFSVLAFSMIFMTIISCNKDEDNSQTTTTPPKTTPPDSKPSATTFKFAANGKDCGITDGYADQQHTLPKLIHLNTDKCNGETFRPTITLNFAEVPVPGVYTVTTETPTNKSFNISSVQYNYTSWIGTAGTVVVTQNSDDATKVDIEFKSITMSNENANTDTLNPATDMLTGYIIKI